MHARLTELGGEIDALSASISELHDAVQEISTVLATLGAAYGKVWVESLMANRLLLDAHHRGLVERARDMTSRYLERGRKRWSRLVGQCFGAAKWIPCVG